MSACCYAWAFKSVLFTNEVLYFIYETNRGPWFLRVRVVNSSACPKSLLYIPLWALTAFGKPLFLLNTLETLRMEGKKMLKSDKMVQCEDSSFLRTRSPLFSLKCDLEASWLFCSWSLRDILSTLKRKGGKAEFLRHFFVQDLWLWNKMSFSSTSPIGQLQFLRATVSLWMRNATLNYCKITTLNCSS